MRMINLIKNKWDHIRFWFITKRFSPVDKLMDIGCGNHPQDFIKVNRMHILVDPNFKMAKINSVFYGIHGTWQDALNHAKDHQIDTVVLMDVIEHLEKREGERLLKETQRLVKQIVVFTPYGFMEQNDLGNPWNTHRSAWYPLDFGEGWKVTVFPNFHWCNFEGKELPHPHGAIFAVFNR